MKAIIRKVDEVYFIYIYGSEGVSEAFAVEQVDILVPSLYIQLKPNHEFLYEERKEVS